jgi:ferredoxin-type protein NapF
VDIGRRSFLRGASLTRAGREAATRRQRPLGPLPPWMHDLWQQDACRGCRQPCVLACEQDIIRIHPDGHALAGFPWLDFAGGGCTFCGECIAACPLDHTRDATPIPGRVQLMQRRCLGWNDVICLSCKGACGARALELDRHRRVTVAVERCNGCGMCVSICPVGALVVEPDSHAGKKFGLATRSDVSS